MKTQQLIPMLIAIIMACAPSVTEANINIHAKAEYASNLHPRKGRMAKIKSNRIKRQLIKREMKRRWIRPRHRGITIVL
ncbi:MAG: hypothetical protein ACK4YD_10980 [Chitinophagia bacterium]